MLGMLGLLIFAGACGPQARRTDPRPPHSHPHEPPHGGAVVVLGDEEYHLEVLADAEEGWLRVYVLDGHMDTFIRLPVPHVDLVIRTDGQEQPLRLTAVRRPGEETGPSETALFEARADWLKGLDRFEAELVRLPIRGREYRHVRFAYPEGHASGASPGP